MGYTVVHRDYALTGSDIKVFKRVGLIDQWGNGLKLIADELNAYPEVEFKWFERGGLQFQVQFINSEFFASVY